MDHATKLSERRRPSCGSVSQGDVRLKQSLSREYVTCANTVRHANTDRSSESSRDGWKSVREVVGAFDVDGGQAKSERTAENPGGSPAGRR